MQPLRRRPLSMLALAGVFGVAASASWGQAASAPGDGSSQAREMRAWLLRIHEAASHRNYQGTFIVSSSGGVSSARIAHYCEGPNEYERSESLDGQTRKVYRHNEVVTTLLPASKTATIEQRTMLAEFPALLQSSDDRIADFYEVRAQGTDRIAGHETNVLVVKPRDSYRYGYRLWAEQGSGLLLRADVLGERGEVLESSAFSDVTIGVKPQLDSVLAPIRKLDAYRVARPVLSPTRLETEGWSMRQGVAGFRQVSCVKRPLEASAPAPLAAMASTTAAPATVNGPQILQAIYSDGLTYVSVFIEPYDPQRHVRPMLASVGPTQTLMQQQGDWWITVVGDVPTSTLRSFAKGLERLKK